MPAAEQLITDNLEIWTSAVQMKSASGRGKSNKLDIYGIKKLRELILELAMRGSLVPQDPNDEPASELLKKIAAEKAQLVKDGKIKKPRELPALEDEDRAFDLPDGWEWVRFGEIARHNAGKTLDKRRNTGEPRDYLTTSNLYWGRFDLTEVRQMLIKEDELEKCTARQGDLLICEGGEAGRAAVWAEPGEICFQNHIHRARFYGDLNPYYAYRYFELLSASGEIEKYRKGVGISNMSGKALATIPFVLPPLAEQARIVAKVDELMALCDQLEQQQEASITAHQALVQTLLDALTTASERDGFTAAWARIADHFDTLFTTEWSIDQLKQTILQLAVMGKLVPQDPNDEPACELLKKIAAEKAQLVKDGKIKKQKALPEIRDDEEPFELPDGWVWTRLGDLFALVTDGDHQAPPKVDAGVPFLVIGNLNTGRVDLRNSRFVPSEYFESLDWVRKPAKGDLLYTVTGSYGIPIEIDVDKAFCVQRHVAILKSVTSSPEEYVSRALKSPYAFAYSTDIATGIAQKTVPLTGLRKMPIPVPPKSEREAIVAKIDALTALCDTLKTRFDTAQTTQSYLADAMAEQADV